MASNVHFDIKNSDSSSLKQITFISYGKSFSMELEDGRYGQLLYELLQHTEKEAFNYAIKRIKKKVISAIEEIEANGV